MAAERMELEVSELIGAERVGRGSARRIARGIGRGARTRALAR
jgi:hypothetical protein